MPTGGGDIILDFQENGTDSVGLAETITVAISKQETVTASESLIKSGNQVFSIDGITASDSITTAGEVNDSITATEEIKMAGEMQESITTGETLSKSLSIEKSESITGAESISASIPLSENIGTLESIGMATAFSEGIITSDSIKTDIGLQESINTSESSLTVLSKAFSEGITLTDIASMATILSESIGSSESITLSETMSDAITSAESFLFGMNIQDNVGLNETLGKGLIIEKNDGISTTENISASAEIGDNIGSSEEISASSHFSEGISISDSTKALCEIEGNESITTSDMAVYGYAMSGTDGISITDSMMDMSMKKTENILATENLEAGLIPVDLSEAITVTDSSGILLEGLESISLTESKLFAEEYGESIHVNDGETMIYILPTDSILATESLFPSVRITLNDSIATMESKEITASVELSNSISIAEEIGALAGWTESISTSDSMDEVKISYTETIDGTESIHTTYIPAAYTDNITTAESINARIPVSESIATNESMAKALSISKTDSIVASDHYSFNMTGSFSEGIIVSDSMSSIRLETTEGISLLESKTIVMDVEITSAVSLSDSGGYATGMQDTIHVLDADSMIYTLPTETITSTENIDYSLHRHARMNDVRAYGITVSNLRSIEPKIDKARGNEAEISDVRGE